MNNSKILSTALELKVKYKNSVVTSGLINKSNLHSILNVVRFSNNAGIFPIPYSSNGLQVKDAVVVYEDVYGKIKIALPIDFPEQYENLLDNIKVVSADKFETIKKIIDDNILSKRYDNYMKVSPHVALPEGSLTYYTSKIELNDNGVPVDGFFVDSSLNVYTADIQLAKFASRYIIQVNGIQAYNQEQFIQMLRKFSQIYVIGKEHIQWFKDIHEVSVEVICGIPFYLRTVIYFNNFEVEPDCGLRLKKGVVVMDYETLIASPDVWKIIKRTPNLTPSRAE